MPYAPPGRIERFSIVKTPDYATRVHFVVIHTIEAFLRRIA